MTSHDVIVHDITLMILLLLTMLLVTDNFLASFPVLPLQLFSHRGKNRFFHGCEKAVRE